MPVSKNLDNAPPNILLIITDQQHINTIAAGGCTHIETPALDNLKERGVSFSQSYSTNPVCSPARSSIFTGCMPSETGVFKNGLSIRDSIPNLGQWFSQKTDLETVYAGKWHLPTTNPAEIKGFTILTGMVSGQGNVWDSAVSQACKGYLWNRSPSKPFLLVASFLQPHDICGWFHQNASVPEKLRYPEIEEQLPSLPDNFNFDNLEPNTVINLRQKRNPIKNQWSEQQWRFYLWSYYRHVEMVDAEIGRLLDALEDSGYEDNTLIILTSDHGEGMGHHQMCLKNYLYDEASKVPFLISSSPSAFQSYLGNTTFPV